MSSHHRLSRTEEFQQFDFSTEQWSFGPAMSGRINPEDVEVGNILQRSNLPYITDDSEATETEDEESKKDGLHPITNLERLIRTHSIWFLPSVKERDEVARLLRGKEQGAFIVRHSRQVNTMALSIKTSPTSDTIEHFLIKHESSSHNRLSQTKGSRMRLECSSNSFDNILSLVYHYSSISDELPVALQLPQVLREATSRQSLTSMALLGRDFWRYPMSFPPTTASAEQITDKSLVIYASSSKLRHQQRRSFVEELLPSHQQALFEHKSNLIKAQQSFTDARWPPPMPKKDFSAALDDTLMDLEEVSNLLDASLNELRTTSGQFEGRKMSAPPAPPPRSARESPAIRRRRSINSSADINERPRDPASFKKVCSVSPNPRRKFSGATAIEDKFKRHHHHYFRSSVADKMSDYEDIWHEREEPQRRSITPAESEQKFKKYLATKLSKDEQTEREDVSSPFSRTSSLSSSMKTSTSKSTSSSKTSSSMTSNCNRINSVYSDPLDALEKAEDTRVYQCPEFGDDSETKDRDDTSDINMNWKKDNDKASDPKSTAGGALSEGETPAEVGCALNKVRKMSRVETDETPSIKTRKTSNTPSSLSSSSKRENRLSAVIGRYIRPPKSLTTNTKRSSKQWQMDSSSWEFLGNDSDADVSSSDSDNDTGKSNLTTLEKDKKDDSLDSSTSNANGKKQRSTSKDSLYESGNNDSLSKSEEVKAVTTAAAALTSTKDVVGVPITQFLHQPASASRDRIRSCVLNLSGQPDGIFSRNVSKFVQCTEESKEKNPAVVMRNIRQFMTGMKNYLIRNGEGDLMTVIEEESDKLEANEFLNVDSILEDVLHTLVIQPLQVHLNQLFSQDFLRSGCLQMLSKSMEKARRENKSASDFHIPNHFQAKLPDTICKCKVELERLRQTFSPVEKLDALLAAIKIILSNSTSPSEALSVDSFCSLLAYVLVQIGTCEWIEMESELMWGLLHPSLLAGEGGYYLTMLSSTIHFLKNLDDLEVDDEPRSEDKEKKSNTLSGGRASASLRAVESVSSLCSGGRVGSLRSSCSHSGTTSSESSSSLGRIRVLIPNDLNGCFITESFPLRRNMIVKDVTKLVAHKMKVTNPEDFAFYSLIEGKETLLNDHDRPEQILRDRCTSPRPLPPGQGSLPSTRQRRESGASKSINGSGSLIRFVYKRQDTTIAWPKEMK